MVAGHGKLREFFLDLEVSKIVLQGELIAEAQAVVVQAETDLHHGAACLFQADEHFVVMVPDLCFFAPDRLPGFIETAILHVGEGEAILEVFAVQQVEAQAGRKDHIGPIFLEGIHGHAVHHAHLEFQTTVGTLERIACQGFGLGTGACNQCQHHQRGD